MQSPNKHLVGKGPRDPPAMHNTYARSKHLVTRCPCLRCCTHARTHYSQQTHTHTHHAGEETKWRAELRQRESARMAALEGEWRKRERAREAEVASMRVEYGQLEERARQVGSLL